MTKVTQETVDRLSEIREELTELVEETRELLRGTSEERHAKAYWLGALVTALSHDHEYLSRDATIEDAIEALQAEVLDTEEAT